MRTRIILVITLFLLITMLFSSAITAQTPPANTNFDANKGFQWLASHCPNGNCQDDMISTAFFTLALRDSGALDHANLGLSYIKSKEDTSQHCWPLGSCKIKDTAFAMWVLNEFGEDTSGAEAYLQDAMSNDPNLKNFWYLEVITSNNGTCKVSYEKSGNNVQKDVPVSQGKFPSCSSSPVPTFFDLNSCLEPNLLTQNPSLELDINCNELGPSTTLAVVFTTSNKYYLMKKADTPREIFTIQNGCFGTAKKSSCNFDASLFTEWVLFNLASDFGVNLYVKNSYDKFKPVDNAMLYLSTNDQIKQQYLKDLIALQRNDGSFNKQVYETAIAALALKASSESQALSQAASWLESKQGSDGSWEGNVLKTAAALYAAFSGAAINLPPPGPGPSEPIFQCGDDFCDPETENSQNCPDDCEQKTSTCDVNSICETSFEDSLSCPQDCSCGDGTCDSQEFSSSSCDIDCEQSLSVTCGNGIVESTEQCDIDQSTGFGEDALCPGECQSDCSCPSEEKKSGFPWWISIIIVILLVGVILFYLKFKGPSKQQQPRKPSEFPFMPQQPSSRSPISMPRISQQPAKKSKVEEELDKSIDEAKKLLKKF